MKKIIRHIMQFNQKNLIIELVRTVIKRSLKWCTKTFYFLRGINVSETDLDFLTSTPYLQNMRFRLRIALRLLLEVVFLGITLLISMIALLKLVGLLDWVVGIGPIFTCVYFISIITGILFSIEKIKGMDEVPLDVYNVSKKIITFQKTSKLYKTSAMVLVIFFKYPLYATNVSFYRFC